MRKYKIHCFFALCNVYLSTQYIIWQGWEESQPGSQKVFYDSKVFRFNISGFSGFHLSFCCNHQLFFSGRFAFVNINSSSILLPFKSCFIVCFSSVFRLICLCCCFWSVCSCRCCQHCESFVICNCQLACLLHLISYHYDFYIF